MVAIELKGKMKALQTQYAYGLSLFGVYGYLTSLLNKTKLSNKQKLEKEDYNFEFGILIKKLKSLGKHKYGMTKYNHLKSAERVGVKSIMDTPKMFYHIVLLLKYDTKARFEEEVARVDSKFLIKKLKTHKFMGYFPDFVKVKEIDNLKQIGGYITWDEDYENIDEFFEKLSFANENKTQIYPTVLGYKKTMMIDNQTIIRDNNQFEVAYGEALMGLVNLKSVYQMEDLKIDFWWKPNFDKEYITISTKG